MLKLVRVPKTGGPEELVVPLIAGEARELVATREALAWSYVSPETPTILRIMEHTLSNGMTRLVDTGYRGDSLGPLATDGTSFFHPLKPGSYIEAWDPRNVELAITRPIASPDFAEDGHIDLALVPTRTRVHWLARGVA